MLVQLNAIKPYRSCGCFDETKRWMIRSARPNRLGSMSRAYIEGDVSSRKTKSVGVGTARNSRTIARGYASPTAISARAATNRTPRIHSLPDHEILEMDSRLAILP